MSSAASTPQTRRRWSFRDRERPPLAIIPSWLISLALHAALLALFASGFWMEGRGSGVGTDDGDYREIGLYQKSAAESQVPNESEATESTAETTFASDSTSLSQPPAISEVAPPLSLPQSTETPTIGFGGPPVPGASSDLSEFVRPSGVRGPSEPAGLAAGGTSFFGAQDQGKRFVYVVDCSGSMTGEPIYVAKAELKASLAGLGEAQRFQIIFYNQQPRVMTIRGDAEAELYRATDINRTLAGHWISGIQADAGTNHVPALKRALTMSPEVIFFLTDADQPELTAKELNEIKTTNGGRSRIHCVEFGKGPELKTDNFLKRLARDNGGTYRYRDVSAFRRR